MQGMHVILRPQKWLLFLLFFSTGLCSASCLDCGATEFESIGGIGEYRFDEKDFCIAERIESERFDDLYEVFFSDDMKSYRKEQCQYSTIESLRKAMPESVISPEANRMLSFWYPSMSLKSSYRLRPSHRECLIQKVLLRKEDARNIAKSKTQRSTSHGSSCYGHCSECNPQAFLDWVFPTPLEKPYIDDFNRDRQRRIDDYTCYAPYLELSYQMTVKELKEDLDTIAKETKSPGLWGGTSGTFYGGEPEPEISYDDRSVSGYLAGCNLKTLKDSKVSKEEKYRAVISRAREVDKELSTLSSEQRMLLSKLYKMASLYAPNVVVREVCLGKSAFFKKDWNNAWKHYEKASPNIRNNEMLAREIGLDYLSAGRNSESCIWLTRHIDAEPVSSLRSESMQLISDLEYACKEEAEKIKDNHVYYWKNDRFPLKVFFPRDFVLSNGVSYREEFDHAMFNWMNAARGKMSFVYVHKKKDADIVVDFSYHKIKYKDKYSKTNIPKLTIKPQAFACTNVYSRQLPNSMLCPIDNAEIHFFYDSCHYGAGRIREACMHEIGHALGLKNHSEDSKALMYPYMSSLKKGRNITKDELVRLNKLYNKHPIKKAAYKEYVIGLKAKGLRFKPQLVSMGSRPD